MPPLRVCFFNRSYWPDHGATGQLLTELAEALVREYACKISVVVGPPLSNGEVAAVRARSWIPVRREWRNGVQIFRAASTVFKPQRFTGRAANYLSYFLGACLAGLWVPRADVVVSLTDPPSLVWPRSSPPAGPVRALCSSAKTFFRSRLAPRGFS
jgi:colanic acid biosynthesis glycosyl transferase WcaI